MFLMFRVNVTSRIISKAKDPRAQVKPLGMVFHALLMLEVADSLGTHCHQVFVFSTAILVSRWWLHLTSYCVYGEKNDVQQAK